MPVIGYDHVALPARNPEALLAFYKRLGFGTIHEEEFLAGKYPIFAIQIGENAKLNFHGPALWQNPGFEAKGPTAQPGCGATYGRIGTLAPATRSPAASNARARTDCVPTSSARIRSAVTAGPAAAHPG